MTKLHKILSALVLTVLIVSGMPTHAQVKWHTIADAATTSIGQRLYFVDFYTTWCGYCKKMDRETFTDATVAAILNKYYYPVKFDAEGKGTVSWFGHTYEPARGGRSRIHSFAHGLQGFPSFVLYKADGTVLQVIPGFYAASDFVVVLWYFASGDYQRYPFDHYKRIFNTDIRPTMVRELKKK